MASSTATAAAYPADVPLTGHNVRPGEKPPVYPAAARTADQAGANAFAEFFMKTLDWAYATTNPSYMKHYYGPTCGLCDGIATGIAKTAADHHWYEGGRISIKSAATTSAGSVTAPAKYCTAITADIGTGSTTDGSGKVYSGQGFLGNQSFKLCESRPASGWQLTFLVGTS